MQLLRNAESEARVTAEVEMQPRPRLQVGGGPPVGPWKATNFWSPTQPIYPLPFAIYSFSGSIYATCHGFGFIGGRRVRDRMSSNKKSSLTGYLPDILMAAAAVRIHLFALWLHIQN
jgi:hypothetical protein